MIVPKDLSKLYREIISKPPNSSHLRDEEGCVSLLLQTNWIRIHLLRDFSDNSGVAIEVESYLPELGKTADGKEKTTSSSDEGCNTDTRNFAHSMISHLNYLIRLCDYGFKLDFVGPDYLWIASYEIENTPSLKFFELLIPPS